ncbi:MAG TPA: hypothetical protein VMJ10_30260 [Kofleriaceae bacterium]|nr:hypothetical protein [Kofleriaceae bacterium]
MPPDPAAKRLDDLSANLAEVLRHADALLDEWARFGASVRAQVEREAGQVASAVGDATGVAIERAASAQLANLRAEVAQLEQRVRAAARIVADQRAHDRRLLGGIAAGVAIAIALLVVLVVRGPNTAAGVSIAPEPIRVEPASVPPPDARPVDAAIDAPAPPPDAARPPRHR